MAAERLLADQHLALKEALRQQADEAQPDRLAALVLELEVLAEAGVKDPQHRVRVAEGGDHPLVELEVEE